jgi:hypothetical protein
MSGPVEQLPAAAEMLLFAIESAENGLRAAVAQSVTGAVAADVWLTHGYLMLGIARELREGSRPTDAELEDAREKLRGAGLFPERDAESRLQDPGMLPTDKATTYGDQAAGDTVVLHVEQPMPVPNDRGSIQALVRHDLDARERVGVARYGTPLQAFNGRDALRDAYEEVLDLACYLRQEIAEREAQ